MLVRREAILFEFASNYRADALPTDADAVFVENIQWSNEPKLLERKGPKDTLGKRQYCFGGRTASISFDVELKGSGTLGLAPEFGKLLQICGMSQAIVADTSVTYKPLSTGIPHGSLYYYQDGKLKKLHGCRGEVKFDLAAQEFGKAMFTIYGHPDLDIDAAMIDPTYQSVGCPPQFVNANFLINGFAAEISKIEIDLGNVVAKPLSVRTANGVGELRINDRDVKGSIDPENVINTSQNFYSDLENDSVGAFDTGLVGTTAGNRWRITAPRASYRNISEGEREQVRTLAIELGFSEQNGDDEISLVFT